MAWTQVDQSLINHRKTLRLRTILYPDDSCHADVTRDVTRMSHDGCHVDVTLHVTEDIKNITRYATIGHLVSLWLWALDNAPDGDISSLTSAEFADAVGWAGDPDLFRDGLVEVGFLDQNEGKISIHDWADYSGKLIDRRQIDAARQRRYRNALHNADVTRDITRMSRARVEQSRVENIDTTNVVSTRTPRKSSSKKSSTTWEIPDDWQPLTALQGYKPLDYAKTYTYIKETCLKADVDFVTLISAFVVFYPVGQESYHWKDPVRALSNSLNVQIGKLRQRGNSGDRYPSPTANGTRYPGNTTLDEDPQEARRLVFARKAAEMAAEQAEREAQV